MSGTSDVCAVAQVAQLATTTCATNFVLPVSGKIKLVAQVVVATCATCTTAQTSLVPNTYSYLLDFFAVKRAQPL